MASFSPQAASIHHYHHPPRLAAGTEVLQRKKIIKWDSNWPFWNGTGITLWSSWAASWVWHCGGARVVMAPHPHVGGGRGSVSLCEGMHWSNWHHFLFHHLLTSYCLSVLGSIIFAITPGLRLNMRYRSSMPCHNWLPRFYYRRFKWLIGSVFCPLY